MQFRTSRVITLALALLTAPASSELFAAPPASPLSTVTAVSLDGKRLRFEDWVARPTVINIWATWCPPCRSEMPSLQQLASKLDQDGIAVVALSVDTDHNLVREFVLKYGIKILTPIATAPRHAMAALNVSAIPVTLYVEPGGQIVGRHIGDRDWAGESAVQEVRNALSPPRRMPR